ncbi:MAG: hypothetical protein ABW159_16195, partial [Candidatus Thiodiazotropha sp.]
MLTSINSEQLHTRQMPFKEGGLSVSIGHEQQRVTHFLCNPQGRAYLPPCGSSIAQWRPFMFRGL